MMAPLWRRAAAELTGTAALVTTVVGSGIMAQRLSTDGRVQLLANSTATVFGLAVLIAVFGPVSGAHFNPIVTLAERVFGALRTPEAIAYISAQILGGAAGTIIANLMFDLPAVTLSVKTRATPGLWLGEAVATFGLLLVIFGIVRSKRTTAIPFAVAAYIGAAYWFTSSTSFANPAATLARTLTNTFAGISPASAPAFIAAELVGAALALAATVVFHPRFRDNAADVVLPHNTDNPAATGVKEEVLR